MAKFLSIWLFEISTKGPPACEQCMPRPVAYVPGVRNPNCGLLEVTPRGFGCDAVKKMQVCSISVQLGPEATNGGGLVRPVVELTQARLRGEILLCPQASEPWLGVRCQTRQLVIMSNRQRAAVELRMGRFIP